MFTGVLLAALNVQHYITIGGIIAPAVTAICTLVLGWYLNRIDKKAATTVQQTSNTGNGFAQEMREALGRIEDRQILTDRRIQNLEDRLGDSNRPGS